MKRTLTVKTTRTAATGVTALTVATVIASCGGSATTQETSTSPNLPQTTSIPAAAAHNHADLMFTRHMIPHHQQAIQMSDMVLVKQGIDPRVVDMATQIKAAQGPEIEQMQAWLEQWGMPKMPGGPGMGMPEMPGMGMPGMEGMLSPADMQALQAAEGAEGSKLFLIQMIRHHQGAIVMARNEIANGQYPDTVALAESIVSSQQKEIDTMQQILESL